MIDVLKIKNLISIGETHSAIEILKDYYITRNTATYNNLVLLLNQFNEITDRKLTGRPFNKADLIEIQNSILEFVDKSNKNSISNKILTVNNLRRKNIYIPRNKLDQDIKKAISSENAITYVHGQSGSGKTYLIENLLHNVLAENTHSYLIFIKCTENLDLNRILDIIIDLFNQPSLRSLSINEKKLNVNNLLSNSKTMISIDSYEKIRNNEGIKDFIFNLPHPTQLIISSTINEVLDCNYIQVTKLLEIEFQTFSKNLAQKISSDFNFSQDFNWSEFYSISGGLPHLISKIISLSIVKGYKIQKLLQYIKNNDVSISFSDRVLNYIWDKELDYDQKQIINFLSVFQSAFSIKTISAITDFTNDKCISILHSLYEINFIDFYESNKVSLHDIVYYFVNSINGEFKQLRNMQQNKNFEYCSNLLKENGGHANWEKFPNILQEWDYIWNTCKEAYKQNQYDYILSYWSNAENFLFYYGYYETRFILSGWAKEAAEKTNNTKLLPWVMVAYSETDMYLHGDRNKALNSLFDTLALFQQNDDKKGVGYCKYDIARLLRQKKELDKSKEFLLASLEISNLINDERLKAYCLNNLGKLELAFENYKTAENYLVQSMPIWINLKDHAMVAICKRNLLQVNRELGNYEEAEKLYNEAIEIFNGLNTNMEIGEIKYEMSRLYVKSKSYDKANQLLNESEEIFKEAHSQVFLELVNELRNQIKNIHGNI